MHLTTLQRSAILPKMALLLAAMIWAGTGSMAFAHGGGGGGHGGGMGGGGHMGGGHMGGGYMGGGYHHGGGYYGGFYPGFFGFGGLGYGGYGYGGLGYGGLGYGGLGYGGYGGLGYGGYGYGPGYLYNPYLNYGYGTGGYGYGYPNYGYSATYAYPTGMTNSTVVVQTNGPYLGINEQPVADANGTGMQVTNVYSGSAAERAGLKAGDVIHSINGYNTQTHGNITWIIQNAAPNGTLNMNVRHAGAARDVVVVASVR